jgi:hypothetical protein
LTATLPDDRQACRKHRRSCGTMGVRSPQTKGGTMLGGFVVVVALIGFYVASLHFNPWVKCSKCHGKPRPRAWVFGYAHHVCPRCDGTGHQVRFGRRLFRMGPGKPSS